MKKRTAKIIAVILIQAFLCLEPVCLDHRPAQFCQAEEDAAWVINAPPNSTLSPRLNINNPELALAFTGLKSPLRTYADITQQIAAFFHAKQLIPLHQSITESVIIDYLKTNKLEFDPGVVQLAIKISHRLFLNPSLYSEELCREFNIDKEELLRAYKLIQKVPIFHDVYLTSSRHAVFINEMMLLLNDQEALSNILSLKQMVPAEVNLHISPRCQRNCVYCFNHGTGYRHVPPKEFLKPEQIKELLDQIKQGGGKLINFSGGKEPTLNKVLPEMMKYAQSLGLKYRLYTNGIELDEEIRREALKGSWIRISLDAAYARTYAKISGFSPDEGRRNFEKTMENLKHLVREKKELSRRQDNPAEIHVNFVVTKINYKEILDFMDKMSEIGVDGIQISHEYLSQDISDFKDSELAELRGIIAEAKKRIQNNEYPGVRILLSEKLEEQTDPDGFFENLRTPQACRAWQFRIGIDPKGNVFPCVYYVQPEWFNPDYLLGNITQTPLKEILQGLTKRIIAPKLCQHCHKIDAHKNVIMDKLLQDKKFGIPLNKQPFPSSKNLEAMKRQQLETVEKPFFNGRNPEKGHMPRRGTSDRNIAAGVLQQSQLVKQTLHDISQGVILVNGYGIIGSRIAEAARTLGFSVYVIDISRERQKLAAENGFKVYEDINTALSKDKIALVIDATPAGIGEQMKTIYDKNPVKVIYQGGENTSIASQNFQQNIANYEGILGADSIRIVTCNTSAMFNVFIPLIQQFNDADIALEVSSASSDLAAGGEETRSIGRHAEKFKQLLPENLKSKIKSMTSTAVIGKNQKYFHMCRAQVSGKGMTAEKIKRIFAAPESNVILIDCAESDFTAAKIYEMISARYPDPLAPIVRVQQNGAMVQIDYAVPHESNVVVDNMYALFAMLRPDLSLNEIDRRISLLLGIDQIKAEIRAAYAKGEKLPPANPAVELIDQERLIVAQTTPSRALFLIEEAI